MILNTVKDYFKFSREQRTGIFLLLTSIIVLQMIYLLVDFSVKEKYFPDQQKWLSLQTEIDLLKKNRKNDYSTPYSFNPNFITDFKGYKLGMSVQEIDRLLAFRKENKFMNSSKEFQNVTKVSDSLLAVISPYFKFPDWVTNKKQLKNDKNFSSSSFIAKEKTIKIDINEATKEDLIKIYGIGEAISVRILKQRESLGGFVSMEQMEDVWGLSPEVIKNLNAHFKVSKIPNLVKIDINNVSLKVLSQFFYFRYALAKEIVTYRSMNGNIRNVEDLTKIKDFPIEKANIIALYLEF